MRAFELPGERRVAHLEATAFPEDKDANSFYTLGSNDKPGGDQLLLADLLKNPRATRFLQPVCETQLAVGAAENVLDV